MLHYKNFFEVLMFSFFIKRSIALIALSNILFLCSISASTCESAAAEQLFKNEKYRESFSKFLCQSVSNTSPVECVLSWKEEFKGLESIYSKNSLQKLNESASKKDYYAKTLKDLKQSFSKWHAQKLPSIQVEKTNFTVLINEIRINSKPNEFHKIPRSFPIFCQQRWTLLFFALIRFRKKNQSAVSKI